MKNFTLLVLYSVDRKVQFENCLSCWSDMPGYEHCEKILAVDGKTNVQPDGWEILEVERSGEFYCWAAAINGGVARASTEFVFYFDSDRVVPQSYFQQAMSVLDREDCFVFPNRLYNITVDVNAMELKKLRDQPDWSKLSADHRVLDPFNVGHKNPFAGCVAFPKKLFEETGGFDPIFQGWGYPDYDYFMNVFKRGLMLYPLNAIELHQRHGVSVNKREFKLHNLWNLKQYVEKWGLSMNPVKERLQTLGVSSGILENSKSLRDFLDRCDRKIKLI